MPIFDAERVVSFAVQGYNQYKCLQSRRANYSEDAIFEFTLCAGVGASLARLEQGMMALKEAA